MAAPLQLGLFTGGSPTVDESFGSLRRTELDHGAWYDHAPRWVTGADTLFVHLRDTMTWQHERRVMYEREVETPQTRSPAPPTVDPEVARLGALTRVGPGGYHESPPPAPLVAPGDVAGGAAQWRLGIVEGDR